LSDSNHIGATSAQRRNKKKRKFLWSAAALGCGNKSSRSREEFLTNRRPEKSRLLSATGLRFPRYFHANNETMSLRWAF